MLLCNIELDRTICAVKKGPIFTYERGGGKEYLKLVQGGGHALYRAEQEGGNACIKLEMKRTD